MLDDGETIRMPMETSSYGAIHRFAAAKSVRSITVTPKASDDAVCLGRFVVLGAAAVSKGAAQASP